MKNTISMNLSMIEGCFLVALGIWFLNVNQLLIGGTSGMSALLAYSLQPSFGFWFFIINIPFFCLALIMLGKALAINTIIAISLVSGFSELLSSVIIINSLPPLLSAIIGGLIAGIGVLLVFRANASLGGINILGLVLEKRYGVHNAVTLAINDALLAIAACIMLPLSSAMYSALSFGILSLVIGRYHKSLFEQSSRPEIEITQKTISEQQTDASETTSNKSYHHSTQEA